MSNRITADTQVTFTAIRGQGHDNLRVVIPKSEYMVVAEDADYIYLQPSIGYEGIALKLGADNE